MSILCGICKQAFASETLVVYTRLPTGIMGYVCASHPGIHPEVPEDLTLGAVVNTEKFQSWGRIIPVRPRRRKK